MTNQHSKHPDWIENIQLSSENMGEQPHTKRIILQTQQWFVKIIYSTESATMEEYEEFLLQNNRNQQILREREKDQYRDTLLQNIDKLIDVGLVIGDDGKYYFHNLAGNSQWPKIGGKNLVSFPSAEFLREHGVIGDREQYMSNKNELAKLFAVLLGAEKIATEEDYKKLFASQLKEVIPELKKIGLEFMGGKYYFRDLLGLKYWPKIGRRTLKSFPDVHFLRKHGILKKHQMFMTNENQLAKLFHVLWFPIDEKLLEKIQNEK